MKKDGFRIWANRIHRGRNANRLSKSFEEMFSLTKDKRQKETKLTALSHCFSSPGWQMKTLIIPWWSGEGALDMLLGRVVWCHSAIAGKTNTCMYPLSHRNSSKMHIYEMPCLPVELLRLETTKMSTTRARLQWGSSHILEQAAWPLKQLYWHGMTFKISHSGEKSKVQNVLGAQVV